MTHFKYIAALFCITFLTLCNSASSQTFTVSGIITDSTRVNPLFGASIIIKSTTDTTGRVITGGVTDTLGKFILSNIPPGSYRIRSAYTSYRAATLDIIVTNADVFAGTIPMEYAGVLLSGVEIKDKQVRMSQDGDTTAFNASAYKTNPDATAEDLVNKLPGVTNDGGTLKVNGEEVKQVLVDGKPYFGDDPNAALKNMPADMIDKVQVYDKSSDQSQFTGFDDGQSKKTINIITKKNTLNGQFGKVYAGYGTDSRYNAGATLNLFKDARRLTFLGMSNNINQQNFSMSDLSGMTGSSGGQGRSGRGGSGGYSRGGSNNFSVAQQGGITTTQSFGVNYSDDWGKKIKVSGSYFFNYSENENSTILSREYFTTSDSALAYNETNSGNSRNINHRFNFRFEYAIDSMNMLVFTSKFTSQFTDNTKSLTGENISNESTPLTSTLTNTQSDNLSYNLSTGVTFRHRFAKQGRTISVDLNETFSPRNGTGSYYSFNKYSNDTTLINQVSETKSGSLSLSSSLAFTEPVGKKGQLLFKYAPSITKSNTDKQTDNFDASANDYSLPDSALTNKYENTYFTQKAGLSYRYNGVKASLIVGNDFQYAVLTGNQTFPVESKVDKGFHNMLPNATFNYKFNKGKNLKVIYRTGTSAPSVGQLQNVIDNTNPLQLKAGNPDLSQSYEHTLITHFGKTNVEKATGFFAFFYAGLTSNYIANSTFIATRDTTVNGVFLNSGSQLTRPENMSGYKNARMFFTYSFALTKLKSNVGFNFSTGASETPARINGTVNYSDNINFGPGITISSNISEKIDFTISYNGSFNTVHNSVQKQSDNQYFTHTASAKFNWLFYKGFVFNTTVDQVYYSGLGQGFNTNFILWNSSLGYKFLKNKSLEAKFSVFDMLNQNKSVTRTVTDTYIEDSRTNTLQRYFMFTLTYNIKHFKTPPPSPAEEAAPAGQKTSPLK
ncbi:MAG: outer membrane beta-barrel protein [Bacteroidia bacterium]